MARIGFIGLGNMGLPMAGNLVKTGHAVQGFDLVADNIAKAEARGRRRRTLGLGRRQGRRRGPHHAAGGQGHARRLGRRHSAGRHARHALHRFLHHRRGLRQDGAPAGRGRPDALPRCPRLGWRRRRGGGNAHLHVRRRRGGLRERQAGSGGHGQARHPLRRRRGRAGGQDLQQHDPRRQHDRRVRGVRDGREARPLAPGPLRRDLHLVRAVLGHHQLLPGAGAGARPHPPTTATRRASPPP